MITYYFVVAQSSKNDITRDGLGGGLGGGDGGSLLDILLIPNEAGITILNEGDLNRDLLGSVDITGRGLGAKR